MSRGRYVVEALAKVPPSEGGGFDQVDDDADATTFGVADTLEFDGWEAYADTRDEAQALCDRMNAA